MQLKNIYTSNNTESCLNKIFSDHNEVSSGTEVKGQDVKELLSSTSQLHDLLATALWMEMMMRGVWGQQSNLIFE